MLVAISKVLKCCVPHVEGCSVLMQIPSCICHVLLQQEFALGFWSDIRYPGQEQSSNLSIWCMLQVLGWEGFVFDSFWNSWGSVRLCAGNKRHCESLETVDQIDELVLPSPMSLPNLTTGHKL